jgi:hypothetical protein
MSGTDLASLLVLDGLVVAAAVGLVVSRAPGGVLSGKAHSAGVVLLGAAAVLLLMALPFGWARVEGRSGPASELTSRLASSPLSTTAVVVSAMTLALAAEAVRRGSASVTVIVGVLGIGWSVVAADALLLSWQVDRQATDLAQISSGPAAWLCLLGGLAALLGARSALRVEAPRPGPGPRGELDEWGTPPRTESVETGDDW